MDYEFKTTFWTDFTIADHFGLDAVKDTYQSATMMGRSPAGIFRYVQTIQSDEDIIAERSRMGL